MKTNRYVTQSAVVLGLFALLTVPQVVGQADEATAPVPTASTETVADSGASVVSGQGTSGTAVQGGTETVQYRSVFFNPSSFPISGTVIQVRFCVGRRLQGLSSDIFEMISSTSSISETSFCSAIVSSSQSLI